jgi:hypothetical protein
MEVPRDRDEGSDNTTKGRCTCVRMPFIPPLTDWMLRDCRIYVRQAPDVTKTKHVRESLSLKARSAQQQPVVGQPFRVCYSAYRRGVMVALDVSLASPNSEHPIHRE